MSEAKQVAATIMQQIKAIDPWALPSWAARQFTCSGPCEEHRGNLSFRVTITAPNTRHYISITLNGRDTYDVERIKIKRGSYERLIEGRTENVYFDQLVEVIDNLCRGK